MNEMLGVDEALSMLETQQQEDGRHWRDGIAAPRQPPVQAVIVVPTFVLGAQVCLTAFRLLGGKVGTRRSK